MNIKWADGVSGMDNPAVNNVLKIIQRNDIISFAGGLPSARSFPINELAAAFHSTLLEEGAAALQYGVADGYEPLRSWVAARLQKQGINCKTGNIIITNGSQQVLDLACRLLVNPGDAIAVENPTYLAAIQVFKGAQARLLPIPVDAQGMNVDELAKVLEYERPKFIYVNPTFQNPTGATMSIQRRSQLAQLGARYQVPIVEDNPYGELRYDGTPVPPIKSFPGGEWVLYAGTISKIVAPGLRIGWMAAEEEFVTKMASAKQLSDVLTNSLTQRALYRYLSDNDIDGHINTIVAQYKEQKNSMLEAMRTFFPAEVTWTLPDGGMFIWATLPEHMDTTKLLSEAIKEKVAFVPGTPFYTDNRGHNTMRLNFSNSTPELIYTGMERLGKLLKVHLG